MAGLELGLAWVGAGFGPGLVWVGAKTNPGPNRSKPGPNPGSNPVAGPKPSSNLAKAGPNQPNMQRVHTHVFYNAFCVNKTSLYDELYHLNSIFVLQHF